MAIGLLKKFSARFDPDAVDSRQYAAIRVAFGALTFLSFASLSPVAVFDFSDQGWLQSSVVSAQRLPWEWSLLDWITSPLGVRIFFIACIVSALMMTIGLLSRLSTLLTFVGMLSLTFRNPALTYGGDTLIRIVLFYLCFAPTGRTWSVDHWFRSRRAQGGFLRAPGWPLLLIQAQICIVYFTSGLNKLHGAAWIEGSAVSTLLANPAFSRLPSSLLAGSSFVGLFLRIVDWVTLAWETSFPFLIGYKRTRGVALAFGVVFHLGIFLFMKTHLYGLVMLASYLSFLPSGFLERIEAGLPSSRAENLSVR
jgi:hypothetical protein